MKFIYIAVTLLVTIDPCNLRSQHAVDNSTSNGGPAAASNRGFDERNPRYRVQPDDALTLSFPLSPEFNQPVTVQPDGYIDLQAAGSLHIQGMTVPEIVAAVRNAYSNILHEPVINVGLTDYQKPFFFVSGQVGKPGQYFMRYDLTVTEAVAMGGGFAPTAKTQVFLFHRVSDGWSEVKQIKLDKFLDGKQVEEDVRVRAGDMLYVPEKKIIRFRKYVPYGIGMSLSQSAFY
jgi:polysaccharide export outer membrane protein